MPQLLEKQQNIDAYSEEEVESEIPMRPGTRRYLARDDFRHITGGNQAMMAVLRDLELRFSARCAVLRESLGLSKEMLPPREWLWLSATYEDIEINCIGVRKRSSLESVVQRFSQRKTLLSLGFVEVRFVAYLNESVDRKAFGELVQQDYDGCAFIVVEDAQGHYHRDEERRCAHLDGCAATQKQYFIDSNAVNAAISALRNETWQEKPYMSLEQCGATSPETTNQPSDAHPAHTPPQTPRLEGVLRNESADGDGVNNYIAIVPYTQEMGTTSLSSPSWQSTEIAVPRELVEAPLTAETVLGLASLITTPVFAVPDRRKLKAKTWATEYAEPASQLLSWATTQARVYEGASRIGGESLDRFTWQLIEDALRYAVTPGSTSWFQRPPNQGGRAKQTPMTLRHIASNKERLHADLCKKQWQPATRLGYHGPSAPRIEIAASHALPGMSMKEAEALFYEIAERHPEALPYLDTSTLQGHPDRFVVGIRRGPGTNAADFIDLYTIAQWRHPTPELRRELTALFAQMRQREEQRDAAMSNASHGIDAPP